MTVSLIKNELLFKLVKMTQKNTKDYAKELDNKDPLKSCRDLFHIPKVNGRDAIYLCGNSLGLMPKAARTYIEQELVAWENLGVEGHFEGKNPWMYYHKLSKPILAEIVGGKESEVVAMNNLTSNLHLMMVSFYRPTKERYKIMVEKGAFPSDQYAVETQVRFHGLNPDEAIVELAPKEGEHTLQTADILAAIQAHGSELALVMMGGVQYYSGQFFDLAAITKLAHEVGAYAGFDLAHAVGNVPLKLHDWDVDFAVWCSYKYMNSSPGGVAGAFVHEKHANNSALPRFAGWWGHDESSRFLMQKGFKPMYGVDGWQLSNATVLTLATHQASLDIFKKAGGMNVLREKSLLLTSYLAFLLDDLNLTEEELNIITPSAPKERGCQLSLLVNKNGKALFEELTKQGVIADWREPNVVRIAPVPLYNSFADVYGFVAILRSHFY